ncbi:MAG: trypsin-like peptidase domain-containing protein [Chloroflexi bacterium]|nr:trypsin-like peptidase domain-containing protein [Chloroflexota bacterium]
MAAVLLAALVIAGLGCSSGGEKPEKASPAAAASPAGSAAAELAKTVVQIVALDADGAPVWTGSGSMISPEGLILTNAHVVDDRTGEYDVLGVALLKQTDEPPEPTYLAEIVAVDYALDLAVVRIALDLDGNPVSVDDLPFVAVGDSDGVEIGDHIRILGYPGIGGETITFTEGSVSGFTSERGLGDRAWIKTDATIAGGNSGGMAADDDGKLIGVPTTAGSGADTDFVDCRFVADTNRDGNIDEEDTCVPIGGFINGLRPVNLAEPLVAAAVSGQSYVSSIAPEPEPAGGFDTEQVIFSNLVFADGVTADDEPTQVWAALPSGVTAVCGFWDYEGMIDGMDWEALWFIDGELSEEGSQLDQTWIGGESGNWWVCVLDDSGLLDGLYELVLSVEGEARGSDAIFVGGDHPPVAFEIDNVSSQEICYAFLSPTGAQNWGFDDLGGDVIPPNESFTLEVPAAMYDLLLEDCDENALIEEYELDISEDSVYTVSDQ